MRHDRQADRDTRSITAVVLDLTSGFHSLLWHVVHQGPGSMIQTFAAHYVPCRVFLLSHCPYRKQRKGATDSAMVQSRKAFIASSGIAGYRMIRTSPRFARCAAKEAAATLRGVMHGRDGARTMCDACVFKRTYKIRVSAILDI